MISKELLSEVMGIKIEDIIDLKIFGKELKYYEKCLFTFCCDNRLSKHKDSLCKSINVYELAHKCKEWAVAQGYNVTSKVTIRGGRGCKTQSIATARLITDTSVFKIYSANTEPQSIFKACQWILDNKSGSSE